MKPLILCLFLHPAFAASLHAEDPVSLGLRGAFNALAPVPEETSYAVRSTAAELLARYVKSRNGSFLFERNTGTIRMWMEMKGLQLIRVTGTAVSQADNANGIAERYLVSVDSEMYRTYDGKAAKWSQWHNGRNFLMPPVIAVIRDPAGNWSASAQALASLTLFSSKGNPAAIPHGKESVSRHVLKSAPSPQSPPVVKSPVGFSSDIVAPVRTPSVPPAPRKPSGADAIEVILGKCISFSVCAVLLVAIFGTLAKLCSGKGAGKPRITNRPPRGVTPPPLRSGGPVSQPPPLPTQSGIPDSNLIDLIQRKETLMTAAEQAFFDVIEPLVRSSCRVSSNVRLADLFEVRHGSGRQSAFNKISRKHVDFVLTEHGTSRILCAIELDDSSHQRPDRIGRDHFVNELFASQNLPLLRVPFAWTYNVPGLRAELLKAGVPFSHAA